MPTSQGAKNDYLPILQAEFTWIEQLISFRIQELCGTHEDLILPRPPALSAEEQPLAHGLINYEQVSPERIAMDLAMMANSMPYLLDELFSKNKDTDQVFTEFGVVLEGDPKRIIPTWQTVFFLYFGEQMLQKFEWTHLIHSAHPIYQHKLLAWPTQPADNPFLTKLVLHPDTMHQWLYPDTSIPPGQQLPAQKLSSDLSWSDLYLNEETWDELQALKRWMSHGDQLMKNPGMARHLSPGIRVLFYGPSGTGKTLAATLLGKEFEHPVYRIDLSQMVSKWVGETEKNLSRVFDIAENKKWILFFDEADALFSRRGKVNNANDRRSNQEIAYLLQRTENYPGTILMASNLRDNMDEAFTRRFQQIIHFDKPDASVREALWRNLLKDTFPMHAQVDLAEIAASYEVTGGQMKNAFRSIMLLVYDRPESQRVITWEDLHQAIQSVLRQSDELSIARRY